MFSSIPIFGSTECGWSQWREELESALRMTQLTVKEEEIKCMAKAMAKITEEAEKVTSEDMGGLMAEIKLSEVAENANVVLYDLLLQRTKGVAKEMVREWAQKLNGVGAWARLRERFGPLEHAGLGDVLKFKWKGGALEDRWRSFRPCVARVQGLVSDSVLEYVVFEGLVECGALPLLEALKLKSPQSWSDIALQVERYLAANRMAGGTTVTMSEGSEPAPMEIGAVGRQVPTKGSGKGGRARECWQCGRAGHLSWECRSGKNGKGKGKGGARRGHGMMRCANCGGTGHAALSCPSTRVMNIMAECEEVGAENEVPNMKDAGAEVSKKEDAGNDVWVLEVSKQDSTVKLLVDSGAAVHCCPKWYADRYGKPVEGRKVILKAAEGGNIQVHGHAQVEMECQGKSLCIKFVVCDVMKPILSVAALRRAGCVVHFGRDDAGSYIERSGEKMQLVENGDLYYVSAKHGRKCEHYTLADGDGDGDNGDGDTSRLYEQDWSAVCVAHGQEEAADEGEGDKVKADVEDDHADHAVENMQDAEEQEGQRPAAKLAPKEPTADERVLHEVTHLPYQKWCMACVCGRGLAAQHRSKQHEDAAVPVVQCDYGFIEGRTYFAAVCTKTGLMMARFVDSKTATDFAVRSLAKFMLHLGHTSVVLQSDAETSMLNVLNAVQKELCTGRPNGLGSVRVRNTGGFSSQSNGAVERSHGIIKGMLRTILYDVAKDTMGWLPTDDGGAGPQWTPDEDKQHRGRRERAQRLEAGHGVVDWAMRHVVWLLNNYHVARKDGRTAHQRHMGTAYAGEVLKFLTPVLSMDERPDAKGKLTSRQNYGLWAGRLVSSNNHLVVNKSGQVVNARTVKAVSLENFRQGTKSSPSEFIASMKDLGIEAQVYPEAAAGRQQAGSSGQAAGSRAGGEAPDAPLGGALIQTNAPVIQPAEGEKRSRESTHSEEPIGAKRARIAALDVLCENEYEQVAFAVEVPESAVCYETDELWRNAMDAEMTSMEKFGVYEWVDKADVPPGVRVVGSRWVHALKGYDLMHYDPSAKHALSKAKHKSRFVAQGFTEEPKETYASTPSATSVRLALILAAVHNWHVQTADVATAFLHAPVDGQVFVRPPAHLQQPGRVWRLKKALYGLKSAPRSWQEHAASKLQGLGWRRLQTDNSVYVKDGDDEMQGVVIVYVDDVLAAGRKAIVDELYKCLSMEVTIKVDEPIGEGQSQQYLGVKIQKTAGGYALNPQEYVQKLISDQGMGGATPVATPGVAQGHDSEWEDTTVGRAEHSRYRTLAGQLLWLAGIRRDIGFAVKELARHVQAPTHGDVKRSKRVVRYLVGAQNLSVPLVPTKTSPDLQLFVDSDWAGRQHTRRSTSGGRILFHDCVITAWSRTQATVALSSAEAEYVALATGVVELEWVCKLLREMEVTVSPPVCWTDSTGARDMCFKNVSKVKHMALKYYFVKERVKAGDIFVKKVASNENPADILTKNVPKDTLMRHRGIFSN